MEVDAKQIHQAFCHASLEAALRLQENDALRAQLAEATGLIETLNAELNQARRGGKVIALDTGSKSANKADTA